MLVSPFPYTAECVVQLVAACLTIYAVAARLPNHVNPILLWLPNVIDYVRAILVVAAFDQCWTNWQWFVVFYLGSQGLDAIDGTVARALNQCSRIGGVLDMLVDRMTTLLLLVVLCTLDAARWNLYASLIVLDIVSHWAQMYSTLSAGATSHKGSSNALLNFYYT
jgi:CDP-diacylglycerol--inositol 3-phosphatidyltransferase